MVEMVEDGGVDGGESLQTSHAPKAGHGALSSSKRQVRMIGLDFFSSPFSLQDPTHKTE